MLLLNDSNTLLLNDSNIKITKMQEISLITLLSPNEYALLQLILEIRNRLKDRAGEPTFTLQQNYITALFKCSPNTLVHSIDRLCELAVIEQVSNNFGECALYRFNSNNYRKLVAKANNQPCILKTGRKKMAKSVTAKTILQYIIGKSIKKNE